MAVGDGAVSVGSVAASGALDAGWRRGDVARLLSVDADAPTELRRLIGSLCTLQRRAGADKWVVELQNKQWTVSAPCLRACAEDDPRGIWATGFRGRRRLLGALLVTAGLLVDAEYSVRNCCGPESEGQLHGNRMVFLAVAAPIVAFTWLVVTVAWCYKLHEPLRDPAVMFPQISELGAGPASARMLYRVGFGSAGALFYATVMLLQELCLPLLPGGRHGEDGITFCRWGLGVAAGIAVQGLFVLETSFSPQTALHLAGTLLFFVAAMNLMAASQALYFEQFEAEEGAKPPPAQLLDCALFAARPLLQNTVWARHSLLMRAPMAMFVIPIGYQLFMRVESPLASSLDFKIGDLLEVHGLKTAVLNGAQGKVVGRQGDRFRVDLGSHGEKALQCANLKSTDQPQVSPAIKNAMGLAQWLLIFNFAVIFASYTPELVVAATLPVPIADGI